MIASKSLDENIMEKEGNIELVAFYTVFINLSAFPPFVLILKSHVTLYGEAFHNVYMYQIMYTLYTLNNMILFSIIPQ